MGVGAHLGALRCDGVLRCAPGCAFGAHLGARSVRTPGALWCAGIDRRKFLRFQHKGVSLGSFREITKRTGEDLAGRIEKEAREECSLGAVPAREPEPSRR